MLSFEQLSNHLVKVVCIAIREMDQLFNKAPKVKKDRIFYRGLRLDNDTLNQIIATKKYTAKNFLSTSPFPEYSFMFTGSSSEKNVSVFF